MKEKYQTLKPEPGKHRDRIGGVGDLWESIGLLQFEMLKREGLKEHHKFLDLGCGSLRLGIHLIPYLNKGNYFGIDMHEWLIKDGIEKELGENLNKEKQPNFLVDEDFSVDKFKTNFDFMIAQSLFTHLPINKIEKCFSKLANVMNEDSRFFFTFFPITKPEEEIKIDEEPYHQTISFYEELANKNGMTFAYLGDWNHPRGQMLAELNKKR